jgi:uncharacterized membrane-anchored protein YitT (DUF2179 family)
MVLRQFIKYLFQFFIEPVLYMINIYIYIIRWLRVATRTMVLSVRVCTWLLLVCSLFSPTQWGRYRAHVYDEDAENSISPYEASDLNSCSSISGLGTTYLLICL